MQTRRDFLKTMGLGLGSVALGAGRAFSRYEGRRRPNIVLIMADDLGYECLGCYGSASYRTPVLDGLVATGMRFDHCYSQPLCTPSRVKIMTGQYNFRNYETFGILDPTQTTFAHVLKGAGYATCVVGKWQLYGSSDQKGPVRGRGAYPSETGFDEHCLWQIDRRDSRYRDPLIVENGRYRDDMKGKYGPDVFTDYALDFIERQKDHPFLLYFPMALTHDPFVPTPDSRQWTQAKHKANTKYFADMVTYMDKLVGRIVNKLDELGLRENTLVLFTADNGTHRSIESRLGDKIIRGAKGRTTDAGTHVPLVASWPGTMPAGRVCDDLIDFTDFLPTLVEAAGARLPRDLPRDGRSFLPQLRGQEGNPREWVFCHYFRDAGDAVQCYARDKRWKLYTSGKLFDVPADPLEEHPITFGAGDMEAAAARQKLQAVLDSLL
jgi:arylsulfatase A